MFVKFCDDKFASYADELFIFIGRDLKRESKSGLHKYVEVNCAGLCESDKTIE